MDQPKSIFSMNFEQSRRLGKLATGTVAMIEGQWKYVRFIGAIRFPYMPKLEDALYDIAKDPDENVNLVDQQKDVAAHMRESIDHEIQKHGGPLE